MGSDARAAACSIQSRRPTLLPLLSVNQTLPSGPVVMPAGELDAVGMVTSVTDPDRVMRPTLLVPMSVNHRPLPSGPAPIWVALLPALGRVHSVATPAVVMRPILRPSVNHRLPSGPVVMAE